MIDFFEGVGLLLIGSNIIFAFIFEIILIPALFILLGIYFYLYAKLLEERVNKSYNKRR